MSYIQPENSNRVNWIKKKFESGEDKSDLITTDKKDKIRTTKDDKVKESLCRTLSASPVTPRKNLKLNVTRQLSNPGRNIKRSPAFRGDKLTRTKNLNSPTKERVVSLVDKNVKLFEDKPEYGKLGKVKKKIGDMGVYDDADSKLFKNCDEFEDNSGYGKVKRLSSAGRCDVGNDSRSQSLDRTNERENFNANKNARRDSVRTTVISRHKNISSIYGTNGDNENNDDDNYYEDREKRASDDSDGLAKLDKFLKNGVEYTKVMKVRSADGRSDKDKNGKNYGEEKIELRDIREELTRRKYDSDIKYEEQNLSDRISRWSKNVSKDDRISNYFLNGDDYSGQARLDFIPVKDIVLKTARDKFSSDSTKSSTFGKTEEIIDNKLTDTLKAALKAPLPSGPPPKKPPRTFAHSPVTNRSPVDDYEEVDGFWQKKKNKNLKKDDFLFSKRENSESSDQKGEKIRSFLHDVGSKQFANNSEVSDEKISAGESGSGGDENEARCGPVKIQNLNSQLHRIMERSKASSNRLENLEDFGNYEPVGSVGILNSEDFLKSVSKLGISQKESGEGVNPRVTESSSRGRGNIPFNESASSEDSAASPLNISYSPQKFKTSPPRSSSCSRSRSSKDSKEMLEKLEHVLIQHKKASGSRVMVPRLEKADPVTKIFGSEFSGDAEMRSGISRHKEIFHKRLSRTLEEGRKLGPLPDLPSSPEHTRNLAFDCLPSFNCVGNSSIYEQIKNPDFKTYLTDKRSSDSSDTSDLTKAQNSQFYLLNSTDCSMDFINPDPYDTLVVSPATKRLSTELTTFTDVKTNLTVKASKNDEEHVYAEPFVFDRNLNTDLVGSEYGISSPISERRFSSNNKQEYSPKSLKKGAELHYMCTPIPINSYIETNNNNVVDELTVTKNRSKENNEANSNNSKKSLLKLAILARPSPDKLDKTKIEQLLDQAFGQPVMAGSETPTDSNTSSDTDSLASSTSISDDHTTTFNERFQIFKEKEKAFRPSKAELHRSQTDKRKHYVRRVSSKYSDRKEALGANRADNLFEVCLLVELNLSTRKPYVKDKYPTHAVTPPWIENFCFPDGLDWPPLESDQNLAYTFVLTDEKGNRRYGYCRRVKPEGAPVCLPLAYCLISKHRASGFYAKFLDALESRHGQPDVMKKNFIEQLYNSGMPRPGQALRLKPCITEYSESDDDVVCSTTTNNNVLINKFTEPCESIPKLTTTILDSERAKTAEDFSDGLNREFSEFYDDDYAIIRLDDHRLEEKDMSQLFDAVSIKVLLILFASLLLERKVVLMSNKLSKLSSCVEALQSLLYPFSWPHPFIPFLPNIPEFSEILQAPSPFVIGILKQRNGFGIEVAPLEDGIVVDLDNSKVLSAVGDESSILPSRLQKGLKSALQMVSNNTKSGDGFRNFLVSEAFLRVFVETCAHCDSHICTQQDGKIVFEKESFVKAAPSRGIQYFLEWFVETTMFNQLIQDRISRLEGVTNDTQSSLSTDQMKLFDQRLAEYLKAADKNSQTRKGMNKKKTLGDRFKDLTNFN